MLLQQLWLRWRIVCALRSRRSSRNIIFSRGTWRVSCRPEFAYERYESVCRREEHPVATSASTAVALPVAVAAHVAPEPPEATDAAEAHLWPSLPTPTVTVLDQAATDDSFNAQMAHACGTDEVAASYPPTTSLTNEEHPQQHGEHVVGFQQTAADAQAAETGNKREGDGSLSGKESDDEADEEAEESSEENTVEVEYVIFPTFPELPSSVPLTYTLAMHACLSMEPIERPTFAQVLLQAVSANV
jgi:hypothetical protein